MQDQSDYANGSGSPSQRPQGTIFVREATWCSYALVTAVALMIAVPGCGPTYCPFSLESRDGQVEYRSVVRAHGDSFRTTLTKREGDRSTSLRLVGKAEAMALSPDEKVLGIALSRGSTITHRVVLIETASLKIRNQLPIPAGTPGPVGNADYVPSIHSFRRMALSDSSRLLATKYMKPSPRGGHEPVVTLWDTKSGDFIRELRLPEADALPSGIPRGRSVSSIAFSGDGALLALSELWIAKDPRAREIDVFIRVWNVSDGNDVAVLRPKGRNFVWDLCLDHTGSYLAGWSWVRQGTGRAQVQVRVWRLAEGKEVAGKLIVGRVRDIVWGEKMGVFKVYTAQNQQVYVSPVKGLKSSR